MKKLVPHIRLENCKEEMDYYQKVFGGEFCVKNKRPFKKQPIFMIFNLYRTLHQNFGYNGYNNKIKVVLSCGQSK